MPKQGSAAVLVLAYAALAGLWIVASDAVVQSLTDDPVLAARLEIIKGLLFVAVSSVLLLLALRAGQPEQSTAVNLTALPGDHGNGTGNRNLIPLFVAILLSAPLLALGIYTLQSREETQDAYSNLTAIAELKGRQIEDWLAERRSDAAALAYSQGFIQRVAAFQRTGDPRERDLVANRLEGLVRNFRYASILLLDAAGKPLLAVGKPHALQPELPAREPSSAQTAPPSMIGPFRDDMQTLHLEFIAPLQLSGPQGKTDVGTVVMHISPEDDLFAVVQSWPTASASGETLLARRDGDSIVYLNGLRHSKAPAMSLRIDHGTPGLPAAVAVHAHQRGVTEGRDYRGVPVLAAYRPVAGTDWHLVAKVDRSEALAPARRLAAWVGVIALFAATLVGTAVLLLLRQQRRANRLALQLQSDQFLRHFYKLPFIGMAITSPKTKIWEQFNDRLCEILGYPREELARKTWSEITHPEDLGKDVEAFQRCLRNESEGYRMEKRFIRKDGTVIQAAIDVKCVRTQDGSVDFFLATVEDITQRKMAEQRITKLARIYAALSRANSAIIHSRGEDELFAGLCQAAVEAGNLKMAWVGLKGEDGQVRVVSSAGHGTEYLQDIRISVHADDPFGRGPTGTAIREDRPYWCQDFRHDPATAHWQKLAEPFGWRASAALPLHCDSAVVGALTLYAGEAGAFDDETQRLLLEMSANVSFGLDFFFREARRTKAEADLRKSEERLRLMFENSLDGVLLSTPDGDILAANPAACRMLGRSEADITRLGRHAIVDQTDPRLPAILEERRRTGRYSGEITMLRGDGSPFPAEVTSVLFTDATGRKRSSVIFRDISQRKQAELQQFQQLDELRRWHDATLRREERILQLKEEINELLTSAGKPPRYTVVEPDDAAHHAGTASLTSSNTAPKEPPA